MVATAPRKRAPRKAPAPASTRRSSLAWRNPPFSRRAADAVRCPLAAPRPGREVLQGGRHGSSFVVLEPGEQFFRSNHSVGIAHQVRQLRPVAFVLDPD